MVARISCPFSSFTLNIALDNASVIVPSCLMSACFAILFGCAKIWEWPENMKSTAVFPFLGIDQAPGLKGPMGECRSGLLKGMICRAWFSGCGTGQIHLGHLQIMVLQVMNVNWSFQVAAIFPVPHFEFVKFTFPGNQDPESPLFIFDCPLPIIFSFKTQFDQLFITEGNSF